MKILITGGSGLLGQYLNKQLSKENDILSLYNNNMGNCTKYNSIKIDLIKYKELTEIFQKFKPDVVVHTASISRADLADSLPKEYVLKLNVGVTEKLAELCKSINSKLIYTSTDLVYDGNCGSMLDEVANLNPVSFYAKTKLMGEESIKDIFDHYIILRTALMFGFGLNHSQNHFQQMYYNLKNGKEIKLFNDQFRTPLSLQEAAELITQLTKKNIYGEILNFGGKERISRFRLGEILCEEAGFDKNLLTSISMKSINGLHVVPDVSMNTDKLASFGIKVKTIRESMCNILPHLKK